VTAESMRAGKAAAEFLQGGERTGEAVRLEPGSGVGYTVPQRFRRDAADKLQIFFRVRRIYRDAFIAVYDGERRIARFKREHMAPGEMENVAIPAMFLKTITGGPLSVRIEED